MKLLEYFKDFLKEEVNLNSSRIKRLDERTTSVTNFLRENITLKNNFLDVIPQGSYAHKTIIRPVKESNDFDADLLLYLKEFEDWDPKEYVENVYKVFRDSPIYRDMVSRRTRCVMIDYAGDFHIDVVPYLERHDEKFITNRHENNFELTNPEGYNSWLDDKNRITNHNLIKVIRLLKYLRDFKTTFSVKSIILNVLLGQQVDDAALLEDPNCYQDVPTTLRTVMNKLKSYLESNFYIPTILDPSGTNENFSDRWDQNGYSNFRKWIIHYATKIDEAYLETDKDKSVEKWQGIFGPEFKAPKTVAIKEASASSLSFRDTEQRLADVGIALRLNPHYKIRLIARVEYKAGFREYTLNESGDKVGLGRSIRFSVVNFNIPEPFQVYWKVLNRGEEAIKRDCVRGTIDLGNRSLKETTSFTGPHYVECFIVKDGVCVARDKQFVEII